jgi:hypothetical protein
MNNKLPLDPITNQTLTMIPLSFDTLNVHLELAYPSQGSIKHFDSTV